MICDIVGTMPIVLKKIMNAEESLPLRKKLEDFLPAV